MTAARGGTKNARGVARRGTVTQGRTPARRFKRGRKLKAPVPVLITSFKAEGSIRQLAHQIYGGFRDIGDGPQYRRRKGKFLALQRNHPDGFPESPGIWVSNQSDPAILGVVNFSGYVRKSSLFLMLNHALSLDYREITKYRYRVKRFKNGRRKRVREAYTELKRYKRAADFRDVYRNWSWKWQVVEVPVVPEKRMKEFRNTPEGKTRVIASDSGANR